MPDEVEGKLVVTHPDATTICEAIAALDGIAGYRVERRKLELISDVYFDGPGLPMFAAGLALRLRTVNGSDLLTLKGESRADNGVISREELEVPWSPGGFDAVLDRLSKGGVALPGVGRARGEKGARPALTALGLVAKAPRQNRRTALTLEHDGEMVAEVAVDAVTFTAGKRAVQHFEIECEAKGSGSATIVRSVLADIAGRYEGLRPCTVSKLELGENLETLEAGGRLAALMRGDRLQPEAYEVIEAMSGASRQTLRP